MANEVTLDLGPSATGRTVTFTIFDSAGAPSTLPAQPMTEASPGLYKGSFPTTLGLGKYVLRLFDGGNYSQSVQIMWDGAQEVDALSLPQSVQTAVWREHMDGTGANATDMKNAVFQIFATAAGFSDGFKANVITPTPVHVGKFYGADGPTGGTALEYDLDNGDRFGKRALKAV